MVHHVWSTLLCFYYVYLFVMLGNTILPSYLPSYSLCLSVSVAHFHIGTLISLCLYSYSILGTRMRGKVRERYNLDVSVNTTITTLMLRLTYVCF
jgi:hypothetical protein